MDFTKALQQKTPELRKEAICNELYSADWDSELSERNGLWVKNAHIGSIGKYTETAEQLRLSFQLIYQTAQPSGCADMPLLEDHSAWAVLTIEREFTHYELDFEKEEVDKDYI